MSSIRGLTNNSVDSRTAIKRFGKCCTRVARRKRCAMLRHLVLERCSRITSVSAIAAVSRPDPLPSNFCRPLAALTLCESITDVSALAALTQQQSLHLGRCWSITDVSALAALTQLLCLDLSVCDKIADVSALAALTVAWVRVKVLAKLAPLLFWYIFRTLT
jgi:hypothetical protein